MHNFCVCSIFKNEAHILEEWLLHYICHGTEHFYLINDNSNDNYMDIINKYSKYITLFHNDIQTNDVGRQIMVYNKYFKNILYESKWFAILDMDEFLYSPNDTHLPNVFDKYDNFAQIRVNWLHFGSNEHLYQPLSVVEGFTKRAVIDESKPYYSYKTIFKGKLLNSFNIHNHNVIGDEIYLKYNETYIPELIINHYSIQSLDFFLKIKATRGDVNNWFDHKKLSRDIAYFNGYDINEIYDDRLYKQNKTIIDLVKNNKISKNDDVSVVLTSCNRPEILDVTLKSFFKYNTYPIYEFYIIDDSGIKGCIDNIISKYPNLNIKLIYNQKNIGQIQSIDKAYSYVKTKYIFHCEDDWEFLQPGFIEKSMKVFNENPTDKIYTIWLRPHHCTNDHPILYDNLQKGYFKMKPDFSYYDKGHIYTWCGFTFNPGLRKTRDCLLFHPYSMKCEKSVKNKKEYIGEYTLNKKYADAGYYAVILDDPKGHVNHISWNDHNIKQMFDVNKQVLFKVHIPFGAGIGNTLKGFISGLSINPNTKIECNPIYILGNFDTVLESKYILNAFDMNNYIIEPFSSCRFLILKSEENIQKDLPYEYSDYNNVDLHNDKLTHLFTSKVTIDHYYNRSLIHDDVYNRIMKAIMQINFQPIIYNELNKFNIDFNTSLGISVRTWTASHEYNIRRKYSIDIYKNAIDAMITQNPSIKTVVLSLDNEIVEPDYMQILNSYPGLNVIIYRETNVNHLQYVIIKMLLLSKCGYFICNRISTFSELVYWFGGCKQKVNALM